MNKPQYWAVDWAGNRRISDKVLTPAEAKKSCYGMVADNMVVHPLGGLKM